MAKYQLLRNRLEQELPAIALQEAPAASDDELALVHELDYIAAITQGSLSPAAQREIGFPWSPAMAERARRSVGATLAAARIAMGSDSQPAQGLAANLAGGTHHAYAAKGSGFCVFNDVAVAARLMQAEFATQSHRLLTCQQKLQVAILDLDVHQGNGTAHIFSTDESVFTLSIHGAKNFPFRKEASSLDVDLPDGCEDAVYLQALDVALQTLEQRFDAGLVLYLAGADPYAGDRLGRLSLSMEGLRARDQRVFEWAWQRRIPLAFCMAGGYGTVIDETVQVQVNTYEQALKYWRQWNSPVHDTA